MGRVFTLGDWVGDFDTADMGDVCDVTVHGVSLSEGMNFLAEFCGTESLNLETRERESGSKVFDLMRDFLEDVGVCCNSFAIGEAASMLLLEC